MKFKKVWAVFDALENIDHHFDTFDGAKDFFRSNKSPYISEPRIKHLRQYSWLGKILKSIRERAIVKLKAA